MSKSLGNYVGINEPPAEMFGKIMSITDELMWRYYLLLTDQTPGQIEGMKASVLQGSLHPLEAKKNLARRIVGDFHGEAAAAQSQKDFEAQFQESALPSDLPSVPYDFVSPRKLFHLLVDLKLCGSNSEAQRKIKEGAVSMCLGTSGPPDWKRLTDPTMEFDARGLSTVIFRVGRRLLKVQLQANK
jgi:tyrosyl-tRNA synthetase